MRGPSRYDVGLEGDLSPSGTVDGDQPEMLLNTFNDTSYR